MAWYEVATILSVIIIVIIISGPVAVKKLNVSNPTEQQMQAFKNEVAVLMSVVIIIMYTALNITSSICTGKLVMLIFYCSWAGLVNHN